MDAMTAGSFEVLVPCGALEPMLDFCRDRLGLRLDLIFPADAPRVAVLSGRGSTLRLVVGAAGPPPTLRYAARPGEPEGVLVAPNGSRVELVPVDAPLEIPPLRPELVLQRATDAWVVGRAGMQYRDLIPGRLGGRFVASHIRIPTGGPVPDYVHYHRVRFQMIFCVRGWVRVVYEDQGPPFVLRAGDCVLQPPQIRHRVLECAPGLEVIELGCPAEHETRVEHELDLPTPVLRPEREYCGQRFVRHVAADAADEPWPPAAGEGWLTRDLGIGPATRGLAGAEVVCVSAGAGSVSRVHDAELQLDVVLDGQLGLHVEGEAPVTLGPGDAVVVPAGQRHALWSSGAAARFLEVTLPGRATGAGVV